MSYCQFYKNVHY